MFSANVDDRNIKIKNNNSNNIKFTFLFYKNIYKIHLYKCQQTNIIKIKICFLMLPIKIPEFPLNLIFSSLIIFIQ